MSWSPEVIHTESSDSYLVLGFSIRLYEPSDCHQELGRVLTLKNKIRNVKIWFHLVISAAQIRSFSSSLCPGLVALPGVTEEGQSCDWSCLPLEGSADH